MPLSEADRIRMLEAIAEDMELKATQRLRALEELGRIESRKKGGRGGAAPTGTEAVDPMADMDELEVRRVRKQQRRAS